MTALPSHLETLVSSGGLAALDGSSRPGAFSEAKVDELLRGVKPSSPRQHELIRASALLWNDHLDAAHRIVQDIETPDGSLIHAIMHRREGDYWNSKYWFRRVGQHPSYGILAEALKGWLPKEDPRLAARLLPNDRWNPDAFVDACESVVTGKLDPNLLQRVQAAEFRAVLAALA